MKAIFWLLVAVGLVYAFYTGAMAVWQYFEIKGIAGTSVEERAKVNPADRPARVREDILRKAPASGVALDEREVFVAEENRVLRVQIRWSYPAIVYKGDTVLSVPLSFDKEFTMSRGR